MRAVYKKIFSIFITLIYFLNTSFLFAADVVNVNASDLIPRAEITVNPSSGTFTEDSIFEVPILLNTKGKSMNTVDLNIQYDPRRLSIVKPSTGKSIIGIWVQPPKYDNTKGTANFAGSIPGGIVSDSSLIITITFQAKSAGTAEVRVMDTSSVLANDGIGTQARLSTSRGLYTILPKPPGGLSIYSDTHPFQDHWYNNNSPTIGWNRDPEVIGFSYVLDNKPNTIPDNQNISNDTSKSYSDLGDGLWYFHVKALRKGGAWGTTTHYLIRIDTTPPAKFEPKVNYLNNDNINRALITFFTTDSLSGMDHYEIGVIDKTQSETSSPLFVRSESPYQVPSSSISNSRVIVRAYDLAGNSIDTQVSVRPPTAFMRFFVDNSSWLLIILLALLLLGYLVHYLLDHNILKKIKIIFHLISGKKKEDVDSVVKEVEEVIGEKEIIKDKIDEQKIKEEVEEVLKKEDEPKEIIPETKQEVKPEDKPEPNLEVKAKPEIKPEAKIEPEVKIETKVEPKPVFTKVEKAEIKSEIAPEIKTEIKIEPQKPLVINEVKVEPKIETIKNVEFMPELPKIDLPVTPLPKVEAQVVSEVKPVLKIPQEAELVVPKPPVENIPIKEPQKHDIFIEIPKKPEIIRPEVPQNVAPLGNNSMKNDTKQANTISMQTSMIKDKLSKPVVNFQTVVDQELPNKTN